jgi:hypothetical protein
MLKGLKHIEWMIHGRGYQNKNMSLLDAVQNASLATKNGCKVVDDGHGTITVYDCQLWNKDNTALLLFLKPNAEISVKSSVNSLTGFKVIINEPTSDSLFMRCLAIVCSTIAFALLFCFSNDYIFPWCFSYFNRSFPKFFFQYNANNVNNQTEL